MRLSGESMPNPHMSSMTLLGRSMREGGVAWTRHQAVDAVALDPDAFYFADYVRGS